MNPVNAEQPVVEHQAPAASSTAAPPQAAPPRRPLSQPVRLLVAAAEVAAAVALVVLAVWAWRRVSVPVELPPSDDPALPRSTTRWSGPWVGAAVVSATVAGVLLLDAVREVVLAARTGDRRSRRQVGEEAA